MYYGNIKKNDIANGEGVRTSLFVSGCRNACKNCFNRETWAFNFGEPYTEETEEEILLASAPSYIRGLTVLGGEPMEPENQRDILPLLKKFKERYPDKTVWLYTGNLYEELVGEVGSHYKCLDITREYDFASNADIPFMVTEFYAKAEENEDGLANTTGAGFFVKTQQDRADHYQSFTLRLLEAKNCVGWHWFQYTDNDPTGNPTDTSSIDANKGIVSNTHTEYTVLTDRMKEINKNVYMLIDYFDAKYAK